MDSVELRLSELERRMANMQRLGTVEELDEGSARVRVRSGGLLTAWIPWFTRRAGADRDWWAPEPGEQVMVLSPYGEPAQGVALPAVYREAHPAPANKKTVRRVEIADGAFAEYDRQSGRLTVSAEGLVRLIGKQTVEIVGKAGGSVKGSVQGDCLCMFTGKPHPHISPTVKESF